MEMDRYQETFNTWNKVAAHYQDRFMNLDLYNETYDFICDSVAASNAKVLEIGCGPGNITKYLLTRRPDFKIFGIDVSPNMIEFAKRNNPDANFEVMDCREIEAVIEKYDAIICGFCIPYLSLSDVEKLIFDCSNLLKEEGFFYISFVEGDPADSGFQITSTGDRSYFYYHDLNELKVKLANGNFMELKTFTVEYNGSSASTTMHTILIAKKTI